MKKWEYKSIVVRTPIKSLFLSTQLNMGKMNKLGNEGWEAVNVQGMGLHNAGMLVLLKRELK